MKSGFVDLDTHKLFYKIKGTGPRVIMVTGTNSDTRHAPSIYDVPGIENFEVLNFDHRGMGQSSTTTTPPEMVDYGADIARLMDHIGWDQAAVIGVSFGGMVAQQFATRHAERLSCLILCCTSSGGAGGSSYPLHELSDLSAEEYAAFIMTKMNLEHTAEWQKDHPEKAQKTYEFYLQGAKGSHSTPEKLAAMKRQFAARARHDVYEQLKSFNKPTLIACGEDDGVAPVDNSQALHKILAGSQLKIFAGGHLFLRENAKTWPTLLAFLTEHCK